MKSQTTDFETESDIDLLVFVGIKEDPKNVDRASNEFYKRHSQALYNKCRRYSNSIGKEGVEDLVQETFLRAFDKAATFQGDDSWDSERQRRQIQAWLGRIAQRIFYDRVDDGTQTDLDVENLPTSFEGDLDVMDDADARKISEHEAKVAVALETLTERERDIIRETMRYTDISKPFNRLPNRVMKEICARWNTTSDNVRQIRSRTRKKMAEIMKEVGTL